MKKATRIMLYSLLGLLLGFVVTGSEEVAVISAVAAPVLAEFAQVPAFTLNTGLGKVTLKSLMEQRGSLWKEMEAITQKAEDEKRDLTEDEDTEFESKRSELNALDKKIERQKYIDGQRAIAAAAGGSPVGESEKEELRKSAKNFSFMKAIRSATDKNYRLDGVELEFHQEAMNEFKEARAGEAGSDQNAVLISEKILRNTEMRDMTATGGTNGDQGGVTVQTSVMGYIEALQARSVLLRNGVDLMTGLSGNFTMSKENSVYSPSWEGENDANAEVSPTYEKVTFSPKRVGGFIDVSKQLLLQSSESIENRLRNQINKGQALAIDRGGVQGPGTGDQLTGILYDTGVGVVAIGDNGGAITDAFLLDMEEQIELANGAFGEIIGLYTPGVKKTLKKLKLDDGSGMFAWDRLTNTVNTYAAEATNQLPTNLVKGTSGAVCHAAILGNLSGCAFGQWGGLEILVDPYTQAINNMTRLVVNQYADFHVLQGGMISVIKDIIVS